MGSNLGVFFLHFFETSTNGVIDFFKKAFYENQIRIIHFGLKFSAIPSK
jgi:hypothetical protein